MLVLENDFNRVNIPGQPIDAAEKLFAEIDGEVDRVLKGVAENATLPEGTDMEILIYFAALLYRRNPQIRSNLERAKTTVIKQMAIEHSYLAPKGMNLIGSR